MQEDVAKKTTTLGNRPTSTHQIPHRQWVSSNELEAIGNARHIISCDHMCANNEAEILGKAWAFEYEQLQIEQKIFAKKAINDTLFEARLGSLSRQSMFINDVANFAQVMARLPSVHSTTN